MAEQVERPGAEAWVPQRPTLRRLQEAVQACHGCELYRDATQAVMGDGAADAELVLLGGPAGKALLGSSFTVGEQRSKQLPWPDDLAVAHPPQWLLATTHPAAVLRARDRRASVYAGLVADLRLAADWL